MLMFKQKEKGHPEKIIRMILALFFCQIFFGLWLSYPVHAAEYEKDGLHYTMEYGKITITGYDGTNPNLVIPEQIDGCPVVGIAGYSIQYNDTIQTLSIADSVVKVGNFAFSRCSNLATVRWTSGCDVIPESCFERDTKLVTITNTGHVNKIEGTAFENCSGLSEITVPVLQTAGWRAFAGCSSLKEVNIPEVETIEGGAFGESGLRNVLVGNKLKKIGDRAFEECKALTSINLQEGLEIIDGAFLNCISLKQINLPSTLNNIYYAFKGSGLTTVTIPAGNSLWCEGAFTDCKNLTSVTLHCTETGRYLFNGCENLTSVTIGSEVQTLNKETFLNCSGIKSISIPDTVKKIDDEAFSGCDRLTMIKGTYNSEAERFAGVIGVTFEGTAAPIADTTITLSKTSYTYTGKACKPSVTVVHNGKKLLQGTDYKVSYEKNVAVGTAEVKITGAGKYTGSTSVKYSINVDTKKTYKSGNLKYKIVSAKSKTVKVVSMVSKKKSSVTIPSTVKIAGGTYKVTNIDARAFQKNKYIKSVVLGKNVKTVSAKAFYGCSKLSKISVKSTELKTVGSNALKGVKKNIRIEVPKKYYKAYKKLWSKKGATVKIVKK